MKLIFALGNPTSMYDDTRHNVGFMVADSFAARHSTKFIEKSKLKAHIAEISINSEKVLVAKPTTYYNDVGQSYRAIIDFYKLSPTDVLIIHDELKLPFGTIRTRVGGSDGGNNGIKSLNQYGGDQTHRLRIGISNDRAEQMNDADFVLSKFSLTERSKLDDISEYTLNIINDFIENLFLVTSQTID